jgi:hypothetical protein
MRTRADSDATIVDDSINPRLEAAMIAIDAALGPGSARAHPQLIAACIIWQVANDIAEAIRDALGVSGFRVTRGPTTCDFMF